MMLGISYLRWGLYAAAAALVGYLMYREHSLTKMVGTERAARIVAEQTIEAKDAELAQERADAERQRKASNDYQTELERLRAAAAAAPAPVVRLCRAAPAVVPEAAGGSSAPDSGGLSQGVGRDPQVSVDIGARLYALVDRADRCAAQGNALIRFYE